MKAKTTEPLRSDKVASQIDLCVLMRILQVGKVTDEQESVIKEALNESFFIMARHGKTA